MLDRPGWQKISGGLIWVGDKRHRLMHFDKPLAPWRATKGEAYQDALDLSVATRDPHSRMVYLTVPARIVSVLPNEETEASLRRRARCLVEIARPSKASRRSPRG